MIFLLLDVFLSYFSDIPTFFVLLSVLLYSKKQFFFFLLIPLVLDLLIVNTYFINTILFTVLFFLVKSLKITKNNFWHYLFLITLIYILYVTLLGIICGYSLFYSIQFILMNYLVNFIFYALSYKIVRPYIKLSR